MSIINNVYSLTTSPPTRSSGIEAAEPPQSRKRKLDQVIASASNAPTGQSQLSFTIKVA